MTEGVPLSWLLPILDRRATLQRMKGREDAARMAAIANLPIGWLFEDPVAHADGIVLRVTGPEGDEIEVSGESPKDAWRAMAEQLAARGEGRLIR